MGIIRERNKDKSRQNKTKHTKKQKTKQQLQIISFSFSWSTCCRKLLAKILAQIIGASLSEPHTGSTRFNRSYGSPFPKISVPYTESPTLVVLASTVRTAVTFPKVFVKKRCQRFLAATCGMASNVETEEARAERLRRRRELYRLRRERETAEERHARFVLVCKLTQCDTPYAYTCSVL